MSGKRTSPSESEWLAMMRKHKFRVGQRVRPSQYGKDSHIFTKTRHNQTGVVTKVGELNSPTVRWEGYKTASGYFAGFIEPDRRRHRS